MEFGSVKSDIIITRAYMRHRLNTFSSTGVNFLRISLLSRTAAMLLLSSLRIGFGTHCKNTFIWTSKVEHICHKKVIRVVGRWSLLSFFVVRTEALKPLTNCSLLSSIWRSFRTVELFLISIVVRRMCSIACSRKS